MSAARQSLIQQTKVSNGYANYNSLLYRGSLSATPGQLAAGQVRVSRNIMALQSDIRTTLDKDFFVGPTGPPGQDGVVNVTYSENIADEFPVFSVQRLSSSWTLSQMNERNNDVSSNYGFMPLGGLFSDSVDSVSYPIYDENAGRFIPQEASKYSESVSVETYPLPNYVSIPFHVNRIIDTISWSCPTGIALRFSIVGKPNSGSDYFTKYYQIQGEKIFEEFPMENSLVTTERRNTNTDYYYTIPLANDTMPQMKSLSCILYNIRYVPSTQRTSYTGTIYNLPSTTNVPENETALLQQGISIRFSCKHYVNTSSS